MDETDISHLRRCVELARKARERGNEPFGSLLVGGDGSVLVELMNTTGNGDVTGQPELAVAAWASINLTADERSAATLRDSPWPETWLRPQMKAEAKLPRRSGRLYCAEAVCRRVSPSCSRSGFFSRP